MDSLREESAKPARRLQRCHEASRLEEQLWNLVFEELWPIAARSPRREPVGEACGEAGRELEGRLYARGA